ncbi:hypothetical protein ACT3SQ_13465 [Brachybacterium sp. AOP42-C2-15]|uniref:hypothetical protein n=1 Tax=unclassified Brachybacterium TaxID=2623841 RepID=UPI003F8E21D3
MTTHITPADHGRHVLDVHDPAELLAEARLCLREPPVDSLILASSGGASSPPMITRSALADLLGPGGGENLERHLALMRDRGGPVVHALIVLGDGYQDLLEPVIHEVMRRAGQLLHAAARTLESESSPAPMFQLLSLHGAAGSTSWELERNLHEGGAGDVGVTATGPLRAFSDTRAAASAVLTGRAIPHHDAPNPMLEEIGRGLRLPALDLSSEADPGKLFTAALSALDRLGGGALSLTPAERMTKCEQIASLLSAIAVERLHWELLAQFVEHGDTRVIDRETLLQTLVSDREWRPHDDVCAGGRWYMGLEKLRRIAAAAMVAALPAERRIARSAWRALTALLVLLAWWNHRFATAGSLVDELREQEPESTLAPLLSRMTDTPIFPAWWPSA